METLVFLIVVLWLMSWVTEKLSPPSQRILRFLARTGVRVLRSLWRNPMRRYGAGKTILVWLLFVAVVMTLVVLLNGLDGLSFIPALVVVWLLVVGYWRLLRWWARRRYTPRPLPNRQRPE